MPGLTEKEGRTKVMLLPEKAVEVNHRLCTFFDRFRHFLNVSVLVMLTKSMEVINNSYNGAG